MDHYLAELTEHKKRRVSRSKPAHPLDIIADQKPRHQVNQPGYRMQQDAEVLKKAGGVLKKVVEDAAAAVLVLAGYQGAVI